MRNYSTMPLNLPLDEKLAASINRRRIAEEQRKQRIFNSKLRQIGVDVDALNYQVHDSILQRAQEEEKERQFAKEALRNDKLSLQIEQQKADELLEENKKIDVFRQTVQRPEYRRDFDLYDPDLKKKERPPRLSDHDPCPISGVQRLEGEDLNYKDRTKRQKEQFRDILLQQMHEKRFANNKRDKEVNDWEKFVLDQDKNALLLEKMETENHRKSIEKLKYDNKILALQNVERNMHQRISDDIEKRKDIEFNFYGPMLSEDPSVAQSSFGWHRVVTDRWKGMSKEQLEKIHNAQIRQIAENQRKRESEQQEVAAWDQQLMNQEKLALLLDGDERRQRFKINKHLESINKDLTQEQRMHKDYMDKVEFRNVVSKDFFSQFNTSSR